jgi:hypothetical protein
MTIFLAANNAASTLAGAISSTATSCTLAAGTGAEFPNPGAGQQFSMTLVSASDSTIREIVYVTAISGDNITTMIRGQEGTAALNWNVNDLAQNLVTAAWLNAFLQASQQQLQSFTFFPDTGAADDYVITPNPAVSANTEGYAFSTVITNTNLTNTPKIKVGSAARVSIVGPGGAGIPIGGLPAGAVVDVVCNAAGNYQLTSTPAFVNVILTGTTTAAAITASGTTTTNGALVANGAATANGSLTANGSVSLVLGFSTPFGTGSDTNGNYTINNLKNNSISFINPANAQVSFENSAGNVMQLYYAGSTAAVATLSVGINTTAGELVALNYRGSNVGNITTNGSTTTYGTTSDYRIKTNLELISGATDRLMSIPCYLGHFTGFEDRPLSDMFLAHELQLACPDAVVGEKDAISQLGEVYVPSGTVVQQEVAQPQEMPAGTAWEKTGEKLVAAEADGKAQYVDIGHIILSQDLVLRTDQPEPHPEDVQAGTMWRLTHTAPKLQVVDPSKMLPLVVAGFQEQKIRGDRLENAVRVMIGVLVGLDPGQAESLQALLAPAQSDDRALPPPAAPRRKRKPTEGES